MELSEQQIHDLILKAAGAFQNAYAPYSEFHVGAAVLGGSGRMYSGCNVENRSYGLTICAERSAVMSAVSAGEKQIEAVLIYTDTEGPTPPCASCRGVLAEFNHHMPVYMVTKTGKQKQTSLSRLLPDPFAFDPKKRTD